MVKFEAMPKIVYLTVPTYVPYSGASHKVCFEPVHLAYSHIKHINTLFCSKL